MDKNLNEQELLTALRERVFDPELGVNIVDLGLVESLENRNGAICLDLIMTTPTCPQGHGLAQEAKTVLEKFANGRPVAARLLEEPLWSPERMNDDAKRKLGWRV